MESSRGKAAKLSESARPKAQPGLVGPVILFTAGGARFAVEAVQVQEIRESDQGVVTRKLKGSLPIDFALQVGLGQGILERLVVLKPGECALGVTGVERIAELPRAVPLPEVFQGQERQWYRGLLLLENEVVPLIRTGYWRQLATSEARP